MIAWRAMLSRSLLVLACLAPVLLSATVAHAQDAAAADALFNKAVADMDAGRYAAACPALAESQRLDPRSGTLFTLATCNVKAGKIATASTLYDDYLRSVADLPAASRAKHADRVKLARAEQDRMRTQIPTLKLVLPAAVPPDARVHRDGTELSAAALGVALPIDPGEHVVSLEAPGRARREQRFSVEKGETKVVELTLGADVPAASAPVAGVSPVPASDGAGSGRRLGAYVAGGAGAVLVIVGAVTGGLALAKKSTVNADCKGLSCSSTGEQAVSAGKTLGTVSTVGFVVGAAGLGAGAVLFFTAPRARTPDAKGARWEGLAIAGGPDGASMSMKGAW
jgi:hypothetical protein